MTEAVRGALELDGNERHAEPVKLAAAVKDLVDQRLADEQRQELADDHPLVMPPREPLGFVEHLVRVPAGVGAG
jgi:hypothetical protein